MHTHFIIPPPQVLREMKGEHEIKEAEDKVEGARVLAVAAKAEREDWEGRQREALSEMRLDQLKVSNKSSPPPIIAFPTDGSRTSIWYRDQRVKLSRRKYSCFLSHNAQSLRVLWNTFRTVQQQSTLKYRRRPTASSWTSSKAFSTCGGACVSPARPVVGSKLTTLKRQRARPAKK